MTDEEFTETLKRLGMSQAALARLLDDLGEQQPAPTTVWRWADGRSRVPIGVGALLRLLEQLPSDLRNQVTRKALRA
jgi:transcriptional regulator with XRE-family HTH domain